MYVFTCVVVCMMVYLYMHVLVCVCVCICVSIFLFCLIVYFEYYSRMDITGISEQCQRLSQICQLPHILLLHSGHSDK